MLEVPTDRPRSAVANHRAASENFVLSAELTEKLKHASRQEGATLFMTVLAGFKMLLMRYTGQEDVAVGTAIAGRTRIETEGLIGFFVNTLVMRTDLSSNPTVRELLRRVRETALEAYAHQEAPFEKLVEELQPERSLSHEPFFQVMFVLQNAPRTTDGVKELRISYEPIEAVTAKYDLTLVLSEVGEELYGRLEYNRELYDRERMMRLREHLRNVLEGIAGDPQRRAMEISMLDGHEMQQVIVEWNDTERGCGGENTVQEMIEGQVEVTPDRIAVTDQEEGQVSYVELNCRANQVAHYLRRRGVRAETAVGISVGRSARMVEGVLGVLKSGGAYVPMDPSYPPARLSYMLEDSRAGILVTEEGSEGVGAETGVERVYLDRQGELIRLESRSNPIGVVEGRNLAYVIYTSGSTGEPKGVSITHGSAVRFVSWAVETYGERLEAVAATTSMCFDLSVFEMFAPLSSGGRVVGGENALGIEKLAAREGVTLINTVPSAMEAVVRSGGLEKRVRGVNLAGEALSGELVRELYESREVEEVWNLYGPSETTTYSTYVKVEERSKWKPTIGRPVSNTEVYVLDGRMEAAAVGVEGELYIGGAGLARGYMNRADQSGERFLPNGYGNAGSRMYRTGDVGRYRGDGEIEYVGRADHQVKMRGYRIELGEIEAALKEEEGIRQSAVVVREYEGGEKRLVGYVVVREGKAVREKELKRGLRGKLPEYMVPWAIVELKEMPMTANGKLDRKRLPAPEIEEAEGRKEDRTSTPVEEIVIGIWSEVLRREQVGVNENFFEIGGHSLLATQVVSRVREALGVEIPLRALFERPTVAGRGEVIEGGLRKGKGVEAREIEAVSREGALPLSYAQE